ncbi:zinc-ribbon domain-containing protein (plasmid) [Clostridium perfringens]
MARKKTHEEFIEEVKDKYGDEYEILGKYVNAETKILIRHNCEKCNNHEWRIRYYQLLKGHGCPVCSGREAKLGVNTIWDTDRWMCDLGVSEVDAKRYSHSSSREIIVKCPDCEKKKEITISNIYQNKTISCSCGDGKSYPEKFVMNVLEQLNIHFETEYSPEWAKPKRYDFHIKDNNCIIETHGEQHYKEKKMRGTRVRALEQEQQNDKYKKETALTNEIEYYIELDCRESNLEWIKESILNSELSKLFDLSKVDWQQCAEFANKNIVKEVCNYWNNKREDETMTNLKKKFQISRTTLINYLKKGTKLGWCNYNPKEEAKKCSKKIEIFKDNQSLGIFESCSELKRQSEELFGVKLVLQNISKVCTGERKQYKGFTFKYVEEDNNLNINKIA